MHTAHRPPRWRRLAAAVLLAAALPVLAGCSSEASDSSGADFRGAAEEAQDAAEDDAAPAEAGRLDAGADGEAAPRQAAAPDLEPVHMVRTSALTVLTGDVPGRYREAVRLAERAGGFVSSEQTDQDREGRRRSVVTLRVPPEGYPGLLADLAGLGELHHRESSTEDVTGQVVDVESRVATQQESVDRVRALMAEATRLSEVVALESELSRRQSDLEALLAQQKWLSERTGLATITLELREPDAEEVAEEDGGPSLGEALAAGWGAFVTTLLWIGVALGAALPFVAAAAVLVLLARWLLLRRRPAPAAASASSAPSPPTAPPVPEGPDGGSGPASGAS